ncbi:unnamed protein product [Porites lobata]|uniref:DDE Tnp4 domain-containing protein n=1 Tax=Porites lobata TaxID=104759 RepID=A0ABN8RZ05_9CNID|nr:unnamed protein product [Porites lobata]
MTTFRNARDLLLLTFCEGSITEDEFLLLYDLNTSKNPEYPYWDYKKFCLQDKDEAECKTEFRFQKNDIPLLLNVLGLPEKITCKQGTVCRGTEALCMLLKRLAYPCRYSDLMSTFGRPVPEISMISNQVVDFIFEHHSHRITGWNHTVLNAHSLQIYADAVSNRGAALDNCFGFVDGTVRPICRPDLNQRLVYNGHKRVHALKFQSVVTPNGLVANLYGPVEGKKHDAGMLRDSGLYNDLQRYAFSPTGQPLCIYGDPAYPLRIHIQAPFRNGILTPRCKTLMPQ